MSIPEIVEEAEQLEARALHCERTNQPNLATLYWRRIEKLLEDAQTILDGTRGKEWKPS